MSKLDDIERGPATGQGFQLMPDMRNLGGGTYVHRSAHVEEPARLGLNSVVWAMAYLMGSSRIGDRCMLGQSVHVGAAVEIGNGCSIQNGAQVFTGVTLEDDVFIGPHAVFTNVLTPRAFQRAPRLKRTLVKRGVSIGANATIVCGVTIGEYAMIGAGTVITRDVEPHALMIGVPARKSCYVCRCGHSLARVGLYHVCGDCKKTYRLSPKEARLVEDDRATP